MPSCPIVNVPEAHGTLDDSAIGVDHGGLTTWNEVMEAVNNYDKKMKLLFDNNKLNDEDQISFEEGLEALKSFKDEHGHHINFVRF